jgi:hypothetical protein
MNRIAFASALALLLAGCGHNFEAATPPGFVELEHQQNYDYRATTADGLVIAVRELDNDPKGAMDFWTRAIENSLRQRGGYALLGTHDVKTKSGLDGKQMRFGHDENGTPHLYYVTVFLTDKRIFVMEAGGTKEQVEKHDAELGYAIDNFRAN